MNEMTPLEQLMEDKISMEEIIDKELKEGRIPPTVITQTYHNILCQLYDTETVKIKRAE